MEEDSDMEEEKDRATPQDVETESPDDGQETGPVAKDEKTDSPVPSDDKERNRRTWIAAGIIVSLVIAGNVALWMSQRDTGQTGGGTTSQRPATGQTITRSGSGTVRDEALFATRPSVTEGELAAVGMRYKRSDSPDHREQWLVVDGQSQQDDPGRDWRFAASVIEAAQSVADIDTKGKSTVESATSRAKEAAGSDANRQEFVQLLEQLKKNETSSRMVYDDDYRKNGASSSSSSSSSQERFTPESILSDAGTSGSFGASPEEPSFFDSLVGASSGKSTSNSTAPTSEQSTTEMPPQSLSGETYADNTEPGFLTTEEHPVSTVAADVDTASYTNFRRMVRDGNAAMDIPGDSVRVEEWLNYFDYDYATPDEGDAFGVTSHLGECPWAEGHKLLTLGFATDPEGAKPTGGRNLVLLVDVSGSMSSDDKLAFLQDAMGTFVEQLGEGDTISLVTYANDGKVVLDGVKGSDHTRIMDAIKGLKASGATNGGAGLKEAYAAAQRHFAEKGTNRIILCSDGDMNLGMSSTEELQGYVDQRRDEGIYLSVLGFGTGNYHDRNMEAIADHGNGTYYYIDCEAEAERVLAKEASVTSVPVADDVKIQVEFNPANVKSYRLVGYVNRTLEAGDFRDDSKDGGEVSAGDRFTVAYEIVPAGADEKKPEVELRYGDGKGATDEGVEFKSQAEVPEGLKSMTCWIGGKEYGKFDPATLSYEIEFGKDEMLPSIPELRDLGKGWSVSSAKADKSASGDAVTNDIVVTDGESTRQYVFKYVTK